MAARVLYAGLHLLDRQLVDRSGRRCGKVDDVELEPDTATGHLFVTHLVSGPGALLYRTGHHRLGAWLERVTAFVFPHDDDGDDPVRIPVGRVADIGNHVTLAAEDAELASHAGERWVREHVIGRIPGSADAPE